MVEGALTERTWAQEDRAAHVRAVRSELSSRQQARRERFAERLQSAGSCSMPQLMLEELRATPLHPRIVTSPQHAMASLFGSSVLGPDDVGPRTTLSSPTSPGSPPLRADGRTIRMLPLGDDAQVQPTRVGWRVPAVQRPDLDLGESLGGGFVIQAHEFKTQDELDEEAATSMGLTGLLEGETLDTLEHDSDSKGAPGDDGDAGPIELELES
eukprot:g1930.t1